MNGGFRPLGFGLKGVGIRDAGLRVLPGLKVKGLGVSGFRQWGSWIEAPIQGIRERTAGALRKGTLRQAALVPKDRTIHL